MLLMDWCLPFWSRVIAILTNDNGAVEVKSARVIYIYSKAHVFIENKKMSSSNLMKRV